MLIPVNNQFLSQAAISDDESPPATHKPHPPKFNTAILSKPSPTSSELPNYENVQQQMTQVKPNRCSQSYRVRVLFTEITI